MKPQFLVSLLSVVLLTLFGSSSIVKAYTCMLTPNNTLNLILSTPTICDLPPYADIRIQTNKTDGVDTAFIVLTVQTPNIPVLISLTQVPTLDTAINGSSVGLVSILKEDATLTEWYLKSFRNETISVQLFALPYHYLNDSHVPIPGTCNQEFNLEDDPTLHLSGKHPINNTRLLFAPANVGVKRGQYTPYCDVGDRSLRFRLTYELYARSTGPSLFDSEQLFAEMLNMTTVDDVIKNGDLVMSFEKTDITQFVKVNYRWRGFIYNVIVTDPLYGTKAAYVPSIVFPCELKPHSLECKNEISFLLILVAVFTGLLGFILCFFGHRIFISQVVFYGFIPLFFKAFMLFGKLVALNAYAICGISGAFGFIGSAFHYVTWWRFGKHLFSMLLAGVNLGFLLTALVFFVTPLENITTFQSPVVFGLTFVCGVLIVPVLTLYFLKMLSIVSTAIWGSYLIIAIISFFAKGIVHYIVYNLLRRAIVKSYAKAHHVYEFEVVDYVLFGAWALAAIIGIIVQYLMTRKDPTPFPPCPYKEWKERRRMRLAEPDRRACQIQQIADDNPEPSETSPLLENRIEY